MSRPRFAVYWAPEPEDPLWAAGCRWLGRDPAQGPAGVPPPDRVEPWRYGFHATLKAPMALADGFSEADLFAALAGVLSDHPAFALPPLQVGTLDGFIALRPMVRCAPLQALADDCVQRLDPLRRPLDPPELARRAARLTDAQNERLQRWGYPHVLDGWRFHLTLSDRIADTMRREALRRQAEAFLGETPGLPRQMATLAVFEEPAPGEPFVLRGRVPLIDRKPS